MKKLKTIQRNLGMTYVELIVVLSIFGVMSSVILFNYRDFQTKIDIKNLASDIALKIVEAQKSSTSGKWPTQIPSVDPWKPSYGVYFNLADDKTFIYFVDLNNANGYESAAGETLDSIIITKGNYIYGIDSCSGSPTVCTSISNPISVFFKRPDSKLLLQTASSLPPFEYIQVTISPSSPSSMKSRIKIYSSGRIQVD